MFKKTLATIMVAAMMATSFNGVGFFDGIEVSAATIWPDSTINSIPYFSSEFDFVRYMDNSDTGEYKSIITETLIDYDQNGGVHKYTAPEDGTIMWATFSTYGNVRGTFYADSKLTNELKWDNWSYSTREETTQIDVEKGKTYYFQQHKWNGQDEIDKAVTFMGFIPKSSNTATMSVETKYIEKGNLPIKEFSSYSDYRTRCNSLVKSGSTLTTELYARGREGDTRYSEVKSFTVKKAGWLCIYADQKYDDVDLELFADKDLNINFGRFSTFVNRETDGIGKIWLNPGTYYFRGNRWSGIDDSNFNSPLKVYLGFIPTEQIIKVSPVAISKDQKTAVVTFTTTVPGSIRVMPGKYTTYYMHEDFWDVNNTTNLLKGNTFTAKENGWYTARFEDTKNGLIHRIVFSVNGIVKNASVTTVKLGKAKIKSAKNVKGKKIKLTLKKVKNATGYEVQYATNKKFKKAKTKKIKKLTVTLKKLKKNKKYFIRVRAFNKTTKGAWSKVKKVKVKK